MHGRPQFDIWDFWDITRAAGEILFPLDADFTVHTQWLSRDGELI